MKLAGSYSFEASRSTVWAALFDPEVLARTLPGCEKLEREGDTFRGEINVKMGPVQGKFQGKVDISDVKELESYTMVVDGRGPAGFVKANAKLGVVAEGPTTTRLDYDSDVQVGGKIASVGQRLLDASSRAIVKQSLEGLSQQIRALAARQAEAAASTSAASSAPAEAAQGHPKDDATLPSVDDRPSAPLPAVAPAGASQAAFALGVAKEVTKELFPLRTVLLFVGGLLFAWLIYRALSAG